MEITKGRFPHTQEIDGAVKVGSPLSLSVYVKDPRKRTDIRVKDCYGLFSIRFDSCGMEKVIIFSFCLKI